MAKVDPIALNTLNKNFRIFQKRMIEQKSPKPEYVISQLNQYEKKYRKMGLEKNFAGGLFSFAEKLDRRGNCDLPGIIYSCLIKMPFLSAPVKEQYALRGLDFAREQGDLIHQLARIIDLKIIYKQLKQDHNYKAILFEEEKVLRTICGNFRSAKENFKTYSRNHSPKSKYELELAKTRVDIAKIVMKNNPNKALAILTKARAAFEKLERPKEVEFVNTMLKQISERPAI